MLNPAISEHIPTSPKKKNQKRHCNLTELNRTNFQSKVFLRLMSE